MVYGIFFHGHDLVHITREGFMRVLLRLQAFHWLLFAIATRVAFSAYYRLGLDELVFAAIPYVTLCVVFGAIWLASILNMKRYVAIRSGQQLARVNSIWLTLDLFKGKNLPNAMGVDAFNAISVSPGFFRFLSRSLPAREFDLNRAAIVKKKGSKEETRFLKLNNRFYTLPDSETQIALVGFNGNSKAAEIDKKVIEDQAGDSLLSVRRWAAYPVNETVSIKRTATNGNGSAAKRAASRSAKAAGKTQRTKGTVKRTAKRSTRKR